MRRVASALKTRLLQFQTWLLDTQIVFCVPLYVLLWCGGVARTSTIGLGSYHLSAFYASLAVDLKAQPVGLVRSHPNGLWKLPVGFHLPASECL